MLRDLYQRLSGAEAHWIDPAINLQPADEARLAAADMLALQAQGAPIRADLETLAPNAERALFPELALDFLWPFGGQPHVRNTRDALFPAGPFPVELGDAWLNRRLDGRERLEAVEAEYLALDVAAILDLDAYKAMALQRQAEIDAACGADFAARLEAEFRHRPLFVNPLAPGTDLLRDLANWTFARLGAPYTLTRDWRPGGHVPELPPHPSVARHFGLAWTQGRRYRLWTADGVDFGEYVRRYLSFCEGPEVETGILTIALGHAEAGLELLEKAAQRPMGRRCERVRRSLTFAFLSAPQSGDAAAALRRAGALEDDDLYPAAEACARGRWSEAEAAALERLHQKPSSVELHLFLALVRERRGDAEGRIEALRGALRLRPGDRHLQSRLTVALASHGDLAGAIASAEAEIALNPENPHARAFLSNLLERAGERESAKAHLQRALEIVAVKPEYAALRTLLTKRSADLEKAVAG